MKLDNTHANNNGKEPKLATFCGTSFIEVHNVLALIVMLIYQRKKVIYESGKVWSCNVSPSNASKLIFKL